ncbi:Xaa-Pro dipeptidyl-peptidase [Actinosynnema mirum]|uniref:Xaa-Pro dipeptidyl-peptidase n=1 Tax=Actinosynnema mirum (strain ATCC 29888 / DSM 43827 / JCM 3225 / NBRC 14064 / NCIMB 13271 / NRRL B-12336 / IMRU 3971 / 101) TaxID=446462 RepID=C6WAE4_ACTMD|nr:Xaa-Pro dipeptidyl-peptidase [Actinosynnema mirum]ACU35411.1 Xaa-Pro dipeptidyl-peptidase [Actinosynnema mirum DSM 43827]
MRGSWRAAGLAAVLALPLGVVPAAAAEEGPVFVDGEAQPVFSASDVVRESLWVRAPVDSDRDGLDDEVYTEVVRQRATERGLKVPVVFLPSPYYSGGNDVDNHDVDVELHVPGGRGSGTPLRARTDERIAAAVGPNAVPITSARYESYFVSRGFAVVYAESLGTGKSTGCPTSGGRNETTGMRSVVDWLNGRTSARTASGAAVSAAWSTGKTAMMGTSYNGTLPNAVAATGVRGLETIVPIAAISSWYDYYRAGGAVVAPGGYQGEDADVLAEYVHTRADRAACAPVLAELTREQDRVTGDFTPFWQERDYVKDAPLVRASVLAVHGLNDWNVKVKQVAQWYEALKLNGVEHKIWLHQSGHTDPDTLRSAQWRRTLNRWFSHYLYGVDNGVEREPKSTVQREDRSWVDEAEWPAPGTAPARLHPWVGGGGKGALRTDAVPGRPLVEELRDDAGKSVEQLVDLPASGNRLAYGTRALTEPVRLSGTPKADLAVSFDRPAANVTAVLVDRSPDGTSRVITRGWADPQNRLDLSVTRPVVPGKRYRVEVELQANDYVVAAGHRLELVLLSSDHDYTLRPAPGAGLSVDLTGTSVELPVVGGKAALRRAAG